MAVRCCDHYACYYFSSQQQPSDVEKHPDVVVILDPPADLIISMLLMELWRKVKDGVQDCSHTVANEQEVVTHSPALFRIQDEGRRDRRANPSGGKGEPETHGVREESILHGHELTNDEGVTITTSSGQADQSLATDQDWDGFGLRANDGANNS